MGVRNRNGTVITHCGDRREESPEEAEAESIQIDFGGGAR